MLIDYGAQSPEEMQDMVKRLQPRLKKLDGMVDMEEFTHTVSEREKLWEVRNGICPCVAGARIPGNAVVLEDVAAPVGKLADLVGGLQQLFRKHGYEGSIFGHAREGNVHPLVT